MHLLSDADDDDVCVPTTPTTTFRMSSDADDDDVCVSSFVELMHRIILPTRTVRYINISNHDNEDDQQKEKKGTQSVLMKSLLSRKSLLFLC